MLYLYAFLILSILNAIKDISAKQSMKWINPDVLAWATAFGTVCISFPFLIFDGIPQDLSSDFLWVFLAGWILYYTGKYFNFSALSIGDISLISPMKWLVSVVVVFSSFLLLDELPNFWWGIGILCILIGTYILSTQKWNTNFFEPFLYLWNNPGARLYLFSIIAYGFTTTIDRIGVQWSSVWFWTVLMNISVIFFSLPWIWKSRVTVIRDIISRWKSFSLLLILHVIVYVSQMWIVSQILASYTTAFKTASALFAVMFGGWFFWEKDIWKRLVSAGIIVIWVGFIAFFW